MSTTSSPASAGPKNLGTFKQVASHPQVSHSERSLRNWFYEGKIKGYRVAGQRQVLLDLDEVLAYANRRRDYGPNAQIVELRPQPVVVHEVGQ